MPVTPTANFVLEIGGTDGNGEDNRRRRTFPWYNPIRRTEKSVSLPTIDRFTLVSTSLAAAATMCQNFGIGATHCASVSVGCFATASTCLAFIFGNASINKNITNLRDELREEMGLDRAKAELDRAKAELDRAEAKLRDAKAELDRAKAELDRAKAELRDAKAELDRARAFGTGTSHSVQSAQESMKEAQKKHDELSRSFNRDAGDDTLNMKNKIPSKAKLEDDILAAGNAVERAARAIQCRN